MPIGALIGGALPGLIQAGGSLFGGGKRRREQAAAQQQFDADQAAVRNFQFENPYKNLENTAEDLTVNQQATNVQAAQTDAALAAAQENIIQSGAGGGGGAAALVSGALGAKQGAAADLAGQEAQNQQLRAQQAASNQQLEAQGAATLQNQQFSQLEGNLGQSGQRLGAANAARQQATQALTSGIASAAGGALAAGGAGAKGDGFFKNLGAGYKAAHSPVARLSPLERGSGGRARRKKVQNEENKAKRAAETTEFYDQLSEGPEVGLGDIGYAAAGAVPFVGGALAARDLTRGALSAGSAAGAAGDVLGGAGAKAALGAAGEVAGIVGAGAALTEAGQLYNKRSFQQMTPEERQAFRTRGSARSATRQRELAPVQRKSPLYKLSKSPVYRTKWM